MDDLISRQQAIDEIKEIYEWHDNVTKERIIEHFERLPSAQTERKGHWIDDVRSGYAFGYYANCSICGYQMDVKAEYGYFHFCPNCGCRMDGDDE